MGDGRYSDECILADGERVAKSGTIQRAPRAQQWNWAMVEGICVTAGENRANQMEFPSRKGVPRPGEVKEKLRVAKRVFLKKQDFEDPPRGFGRTPGCRRCEIGAGEGWGQTKLMHSWTCRSRIEGKLQETEGGRWRLGQTKKRQDRWTADQYQDAQAEGEEEIIEPVTMDGEATDPGDDHGLDADATAKDLHFENVGADP